MGLGARCPEINLIDENQSIELLEVSSEEVTNQSWTHIAVTWDGKHTRFYKNGSPVDDPIETEELTTMLYNDQNLLIGRDSVDQTLYKGILDELRIYNRALSQAEIKMIFEVKSSAQTGGPQTPVVARPVTNTKQDKVEMAKSLFGGILPADAALGQAREERLSRHECID